MVDQWVTKLQGRFDKIIMRLISFQQHFAEIQQAISLNPGILHQVGLFPSQVAGFLAKWLTWLKGYRDNTAHGS